MRLSALATSCLLAIAVAGRVDARSPASQAPTSPAAESPNPESQNPESQNPGSQNPETQNPETQNPESQNPATPTPASRPAVVWIGSMAEGDQGGIHRSELDLQTGRLAPPVLAAPSQGAGYLARHPRQPWLFATGIHDDTRPEGAVDAFAIGPGGQLRRLNHQGSRGTGCCFVALDPTGQAALVANYGSGSVAALGIADDGRLRAATASHQHDGGSVDPQRQTGPHAHAIRCSPDGRFAYACDLGTDHVWIYRLDAARAALELVGKRALPPGSGPRHLRLSADGRTLYAVNELALTVAAFPRDPATGALAEPVITDLLAGGESRERLSASEIALQEDRGAVYCALRDLDDLDRDAIVVLRVTDDGELRRAQRCAVGVRIPRHFALDPSGRWLLCAGQRSGRVVTFAVDAATGQLTASGHGIDVPLPMCVVIEAAGG